jgi:hypothetical protein
MGARDLDVCLYIYSPSTYSKHCTVTEVMKANTDIFPTLELSQSFGKTQTNNHNTKWPMLYWRGPAMCSMRLQRRVFLRNSERWYLDCAKQKRKGVYFRGKRTKNHL